MDAVHGVHNISLLLGDVALFVQLSGMENSSFYVGYRGIEESQHKLFVAPALCFGQDALLVHGVVRVGEAKVYFQTGPFECTC